MRASGILPFDPSQRIILPATMAVKSPKFTRAQWELSAEAREILDSIHLPLTPRPEPVASELSIVMKGNEIWQTMRTGSHVVKQRYTSAFAESPELAIAADPVPFVAVVPTLQAEAAAALDRLATQSIRARRVVRPAPAAVVPRGVLFTVVMLVISVGALALAAWHLTGRLFL